MDSSGSSACGGIIRDHHSNFLRGFYCKVNSSSSILAEAWSLHNGVYVT